MNWRIGLAAVVIVTILCAALAWRTAQTVFVAGFWFEEFPLTFSDGITAALGGPLTDTEVDAIKRTSRDELTRAFAGLKVQFTDRAQGFWTVRVRRSLDRQRVQQLPNAGETFLMGPLGGRSSINFTEVVFAAIAHAPAGATRQMLLDGIARGTGRAAAHELAHAILGITASMDDRTDAESYEYYTHNRRAQYYGELHWARAWPVLVERVGAAETFATRSGESHVAQR
jgi:hypothetical protein